MSQITALFDSLKGLWWPVAAVIIAVMYKGQIKTLLPRLRRAGPTGVEFDPAAQQQAVSVTGPTNPAPGQLREFPGIVRTPAIEQFERRLQTELAARADLPDEETKRDLLITVLAQTQLAAAYERIYNVIFGSQIALIRRLHEMGHMSTEDAHSFFDLYATRYPQIYNDYTFAQWVDFLVNMGLVSRQGDFLEITDAGREFLPYLTRRGLTENKAG